METISKLQKMVSKWKIKSFIILIMDGISTFRIFPEKRHFDYAKWQKMSIEELESKNKRFKQIIKGQLIGFFLCIVLMFTSFTLIMMKHDITGVIIVFIWLGILIYAKLFYDN